MTYLDVLAERFFAKVEFTGGCWLWRACIASGGYGHFRIGSRSDGSRRGMLAHRWVYEFCVRPIPPGMTLDHLCRIRRCVNPDHLEVVTNKENILRGASFAARNARKTHCPHGHLYDEANTYISQKNQRRCHTCNRIRKAGDYTRWKASL